MRRGKYSVFLASSMIARLKLQGTFLCQNIYHLRSAPIFREAIRFLRANQIASIKRDLIYRENFCNCFFVVHNLLKSKFKNRSRLNCTSQYALFNDVKFISIGVVSVAQSLCNDIFLAFQWALGRQSWPLPPLPH